jgi:hypothetical protein
MHLRSAVGIVLALLFSPKLPSLAALFERKFWRWADAYPQQRIAILKNPGPWTPIVAIRHPRLFPPPL